MTARSKAEKGINGVDYNHVVFTLHEKWYSQARAHGMSVNTWTVNKKNDMKKMLELGVDYITTDEPLLAREVLKELGYGELK